MQTFDLLWLYLVATGISSCSCFRRWGAAEGSKDVWDSSAEVIPEESLEEAVNVALEEVWQPWAVGV